MIFDRHFRGVHRYLSRRVGRELADDLASATFTVAFERRHGFRTESDSALPWLLGIATNLLRNHRRSEQRALEAVARYLQSRIVNGLPHRPPAPLRPACGVHGGRSVQEPDGSTVLTG